MPQLHFHHHFVSIHLMLLFIKLASGCYTIIDVFQYISCYSLSCGVGVVLICSICFNTSHVTLYRSAGSTDGFPVSVSIHLMLLFIQNRGLNFNLPIRFNTSHVTLYHLATNTCALQNTSFNTSHVTLYRKIHSKALLIL